MVVAYRIHFKPAAERELKKLSKPDQKRIVAAIERLAGNPRPMGAVALQGGEGVLRIRIGSYRVLYQVNDEAVMVLVVRVGHRRDVYR